MVVVVQCTVRPLTILYMFRAVLCSSSGGQIVRIQHMVSSLSVSGRGGCAVYCTTTQSDDTICCIHTFRPPEDEHNTARNM